MKEFFEKYENITTFAESLNRTRKGFMAEINFSPSFTGVESEKKADDLLLNGDVETANKIKAIACKQTPKETKTSIINAPYGFVPNVPRFLSGRPDNMYNTKAQTYKSTKVLNIVYFVGAAGIVNADDLAKAGAKLLRVITTLENNGYRCNLYIARYFTDSYIEKKSNNTLNLFVKIKDSGKPLNLAKVAYPIANPAFFRYHCFKWTDTQINVLHTYTMQDKEKLERSCKKFNKNAKWVNYDILSKQTEEQILENILK